MKYLVIFLVIVLLPVKFAIAQSLVPLGAGGDLFCVFLPNGKTDIARKTAKGNKLSSFEKETNTAKKSKGKIFDEIKDLNKIIANLKKAIASPEVWTGFTKKEEKILKPYLATGQIDNSIGFLGTKIQVLTQIVQNLADAAAAAQNTIDRIKDCKQKKLPSEGTFPVAFRSIVGTYDNQTTDSSGSGTVAVFVQIPWTYALTQQSHFCFQSPPGAQTGGNIDGFITANPCYTYTIFNVPGACDSLVEKDGKGNVTVGVSLLTSGEFSYKNFRAKETFVERAGALEAKIRARGWTDSIKFIVRTGSVDTCNGIVFK